MPCEQRTGDIHIAFIDGDLFDAVRHLAEDRVEDLMGDGAVVVVVDGQEDSVRAELVRACGRHCRIDAVLAGLVACSGDHGAVAGSYNNRFAAEFRVSCYLERGEERVHVDMQYGAAGLVMAPIPFGSFDTRCCAHVSTVPEQMFEWKRRCIRARRGTGRGSTTRSFSLNWRISVFRLSNLL